MYNFGIFPKLLHFRKIPTKFGQIEQEFSKILTNFATFCKKSEKKSTILNEKIEIRERCKVSLPFFALNFVKFVCRRLFAKFFDLRSWLSVSLPLRSVETPSPPSRESRFFKPRNNLEPCTDSLELCRRVWHRRKSEQRTFG